MTTWAVIVAAGSGDRLAADRPKAFVGLGGRPLLAESLERLERSDWVDAIVVAAPEGWEEPAILLAEEIGAGKVAQAVTGGRSRAESVRLGTAEVPAEVLERFGAIADAQAEALRLRASLLEKVRAVVSGDESRAEPSAPPDRGGSR